MKNLKKNSLQTFLDDTNNPPFNSSQAVFFGVEFDLTDSYKTGARFGPKAIFDASHQIEFEAPFYGVSLAEKIKIHFAGMLQYSDNAKNVQNISKQMVEDVKQVSLSALKSEKFLLVAGGDHSVSNGIIQAVSEQCNPKDVAWVCFDAHLDLRNALQGMQLSHGSISRRIFETGFNEIFIGIRDTISREEIDFISKNNLASNIFYCPMQPKKFYQKKFPAWMKKENIISDGKLSKKQFESVFSKITQKNLWIELDIDALDSNEFFATGTPMPNGLNFNSLNEALLEIISNAKKKGKKILGFSLVEMSPLLESSAKTYSAKKSISTALEMKAALVFYNVLIYNFLEKFV